jgi:hypothetical protein
MLHTTGPGMRTPASGPRPVLANLTASVAVIALGIMGYWALGRSAALINTFVLLAGVTWCARIVHDLWRPPRRPNAEHP